MREAFQAVQDPYPAPQCPGCGKEMNLHQCPDGYLYICQDISCWWAGPIKPTIEAAYDATIKRYAPKPAFSVTELIERKKAERVLCSSLAEQAATEIARLQELLEPR